MSRSQPRHDRPNLSICVTIKNRSRVNAMGRELELFPNCVRSIVEAVPSDLCCELVITDWRSDDWPLHEWIPSTVESMPATIVTLTGEFSRGRGRNAAALAATSNWLFFLDADCLIGEALLVRGMDLLVNDKAYFPVVYSYRDPDHLSGWWRDEGYGNCMLTRQVFEDSGRFPEYKFWGREDVQFFKRIAAAHDVVREKANGFYHQWHPDDFEWKNRFGQPSPFEVLKQAERQRLAMAAAEIEQTVPFDQPFILLDDAQLAEYLPDHVHAISLLERDGEYGGLPADSASATADLERLRDHGAMFIVFLWSTFWWFDYYADFREHLSGRYQRVVSNERLEIFDLRD
jgi:glycosyltransferase involved in cell wall biosynthesis